MTIKGDNQKLSFDKGTTATIYGHNNVILQNDASNLLRFVDEPFRNVPAANVSTPSTLPTYHPSSSPIQIGQLTLFSNFDAFNTGRSSGVLHLSDWSDIESGFF